MGIRDLDPKVLREILDYSPVTGELTWKPREAHWFSNQGDANKWNARFPGQPALNCIGAKGYKSGAVLGYCAKTALVVWGWWHGEWPDPSLQIDHKNRVPHDNRIANLRLVTVLEQQANRGGIFSK